MPARERHAPTARSLVGHEMNWQTTHVRADSCLPPHSSKKEQTKQKIQLVGQRNYTQTQANILTEIFFTHTKTKTRVVKCRETESFWVRRSPLMPVAQLRITNWILNILFLTENKWTEMSKGLKHEWKEIFNEARRENDTVQTPPRSWLSLTTAILR